MFPQHVEVLTQDKWQDQDLNHRGQLSKLATSTKLGIQELPSPELREIMKLCHLVSPVLYLLAPEWDQAKKQKTVV